MKKVFLVLLVLYVISTLSYFGLSKMTQKSINRIHHYNVIASQATDAENFTESYEALNKANYFLGYGEASHRLGDIALFIMFLTGIGSVCTAVIDKSIIQKNQAQSSP